MLKTKAAVLTHLNAPLSIESLIVPDLKVGQVLVKVIASGICGKQIGEINGQFGEDKHLPHLLGHEGGGVVDAIGEGVKNVNVGDHVVMHWRKGVGIEADPPTYFTKYGKPIGAGPVATFTEYAVVSENRLTSISIDIPFYVAALMGCAITTAFGLINNEAKLKMGQSIAVYGVGGVGLSIVQGASLVSAHPIIAIDKVDKKLEIAYNCGATHMLNTNVHDVEYEISRIVGKGVDVFVDCTGNVDLISKAYKMTDSIGKTILVGQPYCDDELIIPDMLRNYGGKQLFASQGGFTNPTEDIPRYCKLFKHNKISTVEIATHFFTLDEINDALDVVRSGEAGRCIITM